MNFPNVHGAAVAPKNYFTTVNLPFPSTVRTAGRMQPCKRSARAAPSPPARSTCPRPRRLAVETAPSELAFAVRKLFWPCLAALIFGKTLAYAVEFVASILFMVR